MTGSVLKRGKTWSVVIPLGKSAEGKYRQKWVGGFKTKREAEQERVRLLHEVQTGSYLEPTKLTVGDYLTQWLNEHARTQVETDTWESYESVLRCHLIPCLGTVLLHKLRPAQIQTYYHQKLLDGRVDGKGGLSPTSVLNHHRILHRALAVAVRMEIIPRNPADQVDPPKRNKPKPKVLDDRQAQQLVRLASDHYLGLFILLTVATGLRRGELLALRWEDVSFAQQSLRVERSLSVTKGGLIFKEPKTEDSARSLMIPKVAVEALRAEKERQHAERLELGSDAPPLLLIFRHPDGTPWHPDRISKQVGNLLKRVGLDGTHLHGLRHTNATLQLLAGIPLKVVSARLGHSTIAITADIYSHVLPAMQEEAAGKLDGILGTPETPH